MLPSEELRQQNKEAALIAEEGKQKRRAEPKASSPIELPAGRAPDLAGGVDVEAVRFPANVMMANSKSHFAVGNEYSNSMSVSGGSVRTAAGLRWVVVMPTGMTAELSP
jgi:hypothetical protein